MAEISAAITERFRAFAIEIIKLTNRLNKNFSGRHIAHQLVRSATSAGANYQESRSAESKADFFHKMQIVLKELRESEYWLQLVVGAGLVSGQQDALQVLLKELDELIRIIAQAVLTAKSNSPRHI
jgi:four helix bundle protein